MEFAEQKTPNLGDNPSVPLFTPGCDSTDEDLDLSLSLDISLTPSTDCESIGDRSEDGFAKSRKAFAGTKKTLKSITKPFRKIGQAYTDAKETVKNYEATKLAQIDLKVATKHKPVRMLWSATKLLYSAIRGALLNKVLWGVGLIALSAICPAIPAAIILGVGLAVAAYGIYENTKETYQVAHMAGYSKPVAVAWALGSFLLNTAATAAAFLTFGASSVLSIKATAFLHSTIQFMAQPGFQEAGKILAFALPAALGDITQRLRHRSVWQKQVDANLLYQRRMMERKESEPKTYYVNRGRDARTSIIALHYTPAFTPLLKPNKGHQSKISSLDLYGGGSPQPDPEP